MPNIFHKRSLTSGSIPTTSSLGVGEIAINVPDGKIYIHKSGSVSDSIESAITSNSTANIGTLVLSGSLVVSGSTTSVNSGSIFDVSAQNVSFDFEILEFTGSAYITGSLRINALTATGSLLGTASYATTALTASSALTASYYGGTITSASYAATASYYSGTITSASYSATASNVNTLNQNVLITGSLTVGATSIGASENTLILGPPSAGGAGEGGQLLLQAPGGTYTSASMWDNWQNYTRLLRGTNASSDALVAQWNMHSKQMILPAYTNASAFPGTATANLAVDSSGNVITVSTTGGTVFPYTGNAVITGSLTTTGAITSQANGAMYFRGGDDAELWDINVANTVGLYGQQDQTVGSLKLGSGGGIISGKSSSIGIGTINPTSASLTVNGNIWALSLTGSLQGTATTASYYGGSVTSSSFASTASYVANAISSSFSTTASYGLKANTASYASTASSVNTLNQNVIITGSLTASGLNYPITDGIYSGQVMRTDAAGNLSFADVNGIYQTVKNGEATSLTVGTAVYVSGSQGANPIVYRADSSNPNKMPVQYIIPETITAGAIGRGLLLGILTGYNVNSASSGTPLWIDGNGTLTETRPTGSSDTVQPIAIVTKTGAGGQISVLNPGPVLLPNLQTGYTWVGNGNNYPVATATSSIQNVISSSFASTASYVVTAQTASYVINSISASYAATASQALSASYAPSTPPFPYTGNAVITGSLTVTNTITGSNNSLILAASETGVKATINPYGFKIDGGLGYYGNIVSLFGLTYYTNGSSYYLDIDTFGQVGRIDPGNGRFGMTAVGSQNLYLGNSYNNIELKDTAGGIILNGLTKIKNNTEITGSLNVTGQINASSITGSLLGTASYATQALSSSWAPTGVPNLTQSYIAFGDGSNLLNGSSKFYYEDQSSYKRLWLFGPNGTKYFYTYVDNSNVVIDTHNLIINGNYDLYLRADSNGNIYTYSGGGSNGFASRLEKYNGLKLGGANSFNTANASGNFFTVDGGNSMFGANITALARVHIQGSGTTSATTTFLTQNSSGTTSLKITDDGRTEISGSLGISGVTNENILFSLSGSVAGSSNIKFKSGAGYLGGSVINVGGDSIFNSFSMPYQISSFYSTTSGNPSEIQVGNNNNALQFGIEGSTGGSRMNGTLPYNMFFGCYFNYGLTFHTNNQAVGSINTSGYWFFGGNTSASARVHVRGSGTTSGTTSLLVQNSTPTDLFKITDDGAISTYGPMGIGTSAPSSANYQLKVNGGIDIADNTQALFRIGAHLAGSGYPQAVMQLGAAATRLDIEKNGGGVIFSVSSSGDVTVPGGLEVTNTAKLSGGLILPTSAPSSPTAGSTYVTFSGGTGTLYVYDGSAWLNTVLNP